jgi:diacylglycerol kinase (ATP)
LTAVPVILNPTAGGGRLLRRREELVAAARTAGAQLEFLMTRGPGHATELAAQAAAEERPLVFAFGGDGTYNEVARGLLGSATALGVLPGGTTSVLAYEFDIPRPAERAVIALLGGGDRVMRVGRTDHDEIVLLMLSAGPDSHVLERLRPGFKRFGGRVGVALQALLETATGGRLPQMRVTTDSLAETAGWVIIGTSRCYAGNYHATPGADPFRDDLEVVVQKEHGRGAAMAFLLGIPSGRHVLRADVVREITRRVRIESAAASAAVPYQVDGDVVGTLPVEISIDPRPLTVRLPAAPAVMRIGRELVASAEAGEEVG